ncbi:MAG: sugar transferase [Candidatus Abyssobacteria bacterium SURF_5]|uniref:Sugar transferase n=1 Tax=Abyssobacteria bacterium (strain SURF_5) TaxID=2093360 RepID=A0A3A4NNU6_ABYX5|nr:MAG: sugar transferase [Candidatus Abyssubacteria bacterium SURF_5]
MQSLKIIANGMRFLAFWAIPGFYLLGASAVVSGQWENSLGLLLAATALLIVYVIWLLRLKGERYIKVKAFWERPLALLMLLFSFPLLLLTGLLIKLESPGPALYFQERIGMNSRRRERRCCSASGNPPPLRSERRHVDRRGRDFGGRPFIICKLRSMTADAECCIGAAWSSGDNDPRVTKIGYYIRKTHLDELPQLCNVLRGDMSLIGPRPERPDFITQLSTVVDGYRDRLVVPPGITGLSQVRKEQDQSVDDVVEKLRNDREYIDNVCFSLDVKIALNTVLLMGNLFWSAVRRRTIEKIEPKTPDIIFADNPRSDR